MSAPVPAADPARARIVSIAQDEILTGEAVALDVQAAGVLLRTAGAVIDLAIAIILLLASSLLAFGPLLSVLGPEASVIVSLGMFLVVAVALPTTVESLTGGRSIGKLAVGARIVRMDGGASGIRQAFIRALLGVLEIYFTLGVLALLVGVFTPRGQRLGDLVAGTYAQRTRVPALPDALPPLPPSLAPWAERADVARLPDRDARRLAQFLHHCGRLEPRQRDRIADELLADLKPWVWPQPPGDSLTALFAIAAVRRDREYAAILRRDQRVRALSPIGDGIPRGLAPETQPPTASRVG